ncbi:chromosome partitioning protein ParB [Erysipelotrichaceae bacterium OH741_COT-311]|nr:chromosome partitioning protein ParB [Erysipelotrichaceae bacterium OH741_COT-311]
MMKIQFPVMNLKMIPMDKIEANDYNPNKVATPEMKLLELSIKEDGYTMPIVVYYDSNKDKYIIVDGFHRFTVGKKLNIDAIPATIIDKPLENRMASTIRHNRARGTHQIRNMSDIVVDLINSGWTDEQIAKQLGMDAEELIRLKQISGLKSAFMDHEFSKSWEEFKSKNKI